MFFVLFCLFISVGIHRPASDPVSGLWDGMCRCGCGAARVWFLLREGRGQFGGAVMKRRSSWSRFSLSQRFLSLCFQSSDEQTVTAPTRIKTGLKPDQNRGTCRTRVRSGTRTWSRIESGSGSLDPKPDHGSVGRTGFLETYFVSMEMRIFPPAEVLITLIEY